MSGIPMVDLRASVGMASQACGATGVLSNQTSRPLYVIHTSQDSATNKKAR